MYLRHLLSYHGSLAKIHACYGVIPCLKLSWQHGVPASLVEFIAFLNVFNSWFHHGTFSCQRFSVQDTLYGKL